MSDHAIFRSNGSSISRLLKWAGILVLALVALVMVVVGTLAALGGNWLRGAAERAALEKTGRVLRIDGDVRLHPGWPQLHVEAGKISFANADWAAPPANMLTVEQADFAVRLPQLLIGQVVIDDLRLRHADIALAKDAQGRKNWELPGGPSQVTIEHMALDDSRIGYDDPAHKTSMRARITTTATGLAFTAKGSFAGQSLDARGSGGPLLALRDESEPYPFDVAASIGATHAAAKGTVTGLQNLTAIDATATVSGDSLEQLFPLLGVALPATKTYRTSGRVVHQDKVWRYEKFAAHIGGSDVSGTLQVDTAGKRPTMKGDLIFGLLDVADLGATIGTDRTSGRALPDARFNPGRWGSVDADVRLSAQRIQRPYGVPLEHFATHLLLRDAVLTLDPLDFGIAGGKLSGTVRLDGRQDPIRASAKIKIAKVALDQLVPGFSNPQVDPGRIDGVVDLAGTGDSVAGMLGDASGSVAVLVNGGHVSRLLMEEIGLHLPRIVLLKLGGDQRVDIRCAAADFAVNGGIMNTRNGVFDTTVTRVDAGGDISLRDETLDLTLNPNTKITSLFSLRTPIHVRGRFIKPDVTLEKGPLAAKTAGAAALAIANPLLALIPLMETGPGRDSDCGKLLTSSAAAEDAKQRGVKPPPPRK